MKSGFPSDMDSTSVKDHKFLEFSFESKGARSASAHLKGVGAKVRKGWYQGLIKDNADVTITERKLILRKINETDPWYTLDQLTRWVYSQRQRAKRNESAENKIGTSRSVPIKFEDNDAFPPAPSQADKPDTISTTKDNVPNPGSQAGDTTTCADVPVLNPKISTFHNTLKEIPPGNDEEVQKLADKCGMDAKVLVQYHSLIHSRNAKVAESASKPPQGSDSAPFPEAHCQETVVRSTSSSRASSSTAHESITGETPSIPTLPESDNANSEKLKIISPLPRPSDPLIPQTLEQFFERFKIYEPQFDSFLDSVDL